MISGTCGEAATWRLDPMNGTLYIEGTGAMEDYTNGNQPWYSFRTKIKKLIVANGITHIGNYAFYGLCEGITEQNSNDYAAYAVIADSVVSIGNYSFASSNFRVVDLGKGIDSVGSSGLTVTKQDNFPPAIIFRGSMPSTRGSTWLSTNQYMIVSDDSWSSDVISSWVSNKVYSKISMGDNSYWVIDYDKRTLTIKGSGPAATYGCILGSDKYGLNLFQSFGQLIETIIVEDGITEIGSYSFYYLQYFKYLYLGEGVNAIKDYSFASFYTYSKLIYIEFKGPQPATYGWNCLGGYYNGTGTPSQFPICVTSGWGNSTTFESVFKVGSSSYSTSCIYRTNRSCGDGVFFDWDGHTKTITLYGDGSGTGAMTDFSSAVNGYFYYLDIENVIIGENVTSIGNYGFSLKGTYIKKVIVSSSVKKIGDYAFKNQYYLSSIILCEGLESIGTSAFASCRRTSTLVFPSTLKTIGDSAFSEIGSNYSTATVVVFRCPKNMISIGSNAFKMPSQTVKVYLYQLFDGDETIYAEYYNSGGNGSIEIEGDRQLVLVKIPAGWRLIDSSYILNSLG